MAALLTPRQVANRLNCSRSLVYKLIDEGRLSAARVGLGSQRPHLRIKPEDLEAYINSPPADGGPDNGEGLQHIKLKSNDSAAAAAN